MCHSGTGYVVRVGTAIVQKVSPGYARTGEDLGCVEIPARILRYLEPRAFRARVPASLRGDLAASLRGDLAASLLGDLAASLRGDLAALRGDLAARTHGRVTITNGNRFMFIRTFIKGIAGIFVLFAFAAGPALAQVPQQEQQPVPDIEVDDEEVETIAKAYVTVVQLQSIYQQRLNEVQDPEQAQAIQQEFADAANSAIEEEGLSVDRYDTVIQVAQVDEELRDRLLLAINELTGQ